MTPNFTLLLKRWGILKRLGERAAQPDCMNIRRWTNGKLIGYCKLLPDLPENFGAPYCATHRAGLQEALFQEALTVGAEVEFGCDIVSYVKDRAAVQLANGESITGDLVVAADGVKSTARSYVVPEEEGRPQETGYSAYRAMVEAEKITQHEDLAWILQNPVVNLW